MFQELLHCSHMCLTSLLGHTKGIFSLMCTEHSISSRTVHQYISWRSCCENIFSVRYVFQATACLVDTLHLIQTRPGYNTTFRIFLYCCRIRSIRHEILICLIAGCCHPGQLLWVLKCSIYSGMFLFLLMFLIIELNYCLFYYIYFYDDKSKTSSASEQDADKARSALNV